MLSSAKPWIGCYGLIQIRGNQPDPPPVAGSRSTQSAAPRWPQNTGWRCRIAGQCCGAILAPPHATALVGVSNDATGTPPPAGVSSPTARGLGTPVGGGLQLGARVIYGCKSRLWCAVFTRSVGGGSKTGRNERLLRRPRLVAPSSIPFAMLAP